MAGTITQAASPRIVQAKSRGSQRRQRARASAAKPKAASKIASRSM